MRAGIPLNFFSLRQKKPLERTFEDLMIELASDLLIESVDLWTLYLLVYLSPQTDLSLIFKIFFRSFFLASGLSVRASFTAAAVSLYDDGGR